MHEYLFIVYRTYLPSHISRVVGLWRESLSKVSEKAGQSLADPKEYDNLFPGLADALKTEHYLKPERSSLLPASAYPDIPVSIFPIFICTFSYHLWIVFIKYLN